MNTTNQKIKWGDYDDESDNDNHVANKKDNKQFTEDTKKEPVHEKGDCDIQKSNSSKRRGQRGGK